MQVQAVSDFGVLLPCLCGAGIPVSNLIPHNLHASTPPDEWLFEVTSLIIVGDRPGVVGQSTYP